MLTATILVLFIIFLITVNYYYKFHRSITKNRTRLPGLEPEWFFGNLRNTGMTSGRSMHEVHHEFKQKYGDAFSFWVGPFHTIVLSRMEHAKHILSDRQAYDMTSRVSETFGIIMPNGLISLRGDTWKRHARFILPIFKRSKILLHLDTIVTCIDRFIDEQFVNQDGKIHTDLVVQCQNVLLNIIALIAFDYDLESSSKTDAINLRNAFNDFVYYANQFILLTGISVWLGKLLLSVNWKYQRALRTMKHYIMNIITEEQKRQQEEFNFFSCIFNKK